MVIRLYLLLKPNSKSSCMSNTFSSSIPIYQVSSGYLLTPFFTMSSFIPSMFSLIEQRKDVKPPHYYYIIPSMRHINITLTSHINSLFHFSIHYINFTFEKPDNNYFITFFIQLDKKSIIVYHFIYLLFHHALPLKQIQTTPQGVYT